MNIKIIARISVFSILFGALLSCAQEEDIDTGNFVVTEEMLIGLWQRTDVNETLIGREFLSDGKGYFGNFETGSFYQFNSFTWALNNNLLEIVRSSDLLLIQEEVIQLPDEALVIKITGSNEIRNFERVQ